MNARSRLATISIATICLLTAAGPVTAPPVCAAILLNFDNVVAGTVVNDAYAQRGVAIRAFGEGGLERVFAVPPCGGGSSPPNVLSIFDVGQCTGITDVQGWIRVTFTLPQPRVAITVIHLGPGTASYLKAFNKAGFVDWTFGQAGPNRVGVPQVLQIAPRPNGKQIDYVEFGAFRDGDPANFDDLSFDVAPVPVESVSWGMVKGLYREP